MTLDQLATVQEPLPGFSFNVGHIPAVIVQDHNEVFPYWSAFKDANLVHVDGHSDLIDGAPYEEAGAWGYYKCLAINNFIVPAFHHKNVSSALWLNPHSETHRLTSTHPAVPTVVESHFGGPQIKWATPEDLVHVVKDSYTQIRRIYQSKQPLILDIDLDAFCCHKDISNVPFKDYGITGLRNIGAKIQSMSDLLIGLKRPNIITICRSHGSHYFVPSDKVDEVQYDCVVSLQTLYDHNGKKANLNLPDDDFFGAYPAP